MATRYALERDGRRFCPVVDGQPGFETATEAMLHAIEVMPAEAHLWHWVPIKVEDQPRRDGCQA